MTQTDLTQTDHTQTDLTHTDHTQLESTLPSSSENAPASAPTACRRRGVRVVHLCLGHDADDARVFHQFCLALADAGFEVHLFASAAQVPTDSSVIVHEVAPPSSRLRRFGLAWSVARQARALKPSIIHVHEPILLGPAITLRGRAKVIWDVHEDYLEVAKARHWIPGPLRKPLAIWWKWNEERLLRKAAAVVVANPPYLDRYRHLNKRAMVLANFPDPRPLVTRDSRLAPTAVYTGTILPNRGLSQTVEAIAAARRRGTDIILLIAGPSSEDGYMELVMASAQSLGVGDLVTYFGRLPREEALALQRRATMGIVPHLPVGNNLNAWSVKMIEFMEAGLPLVYSDIPSHRQTVLDDEVGVCVDARDPELIADGMIRLANSPEESARFGKNGRAVVVDRLNWSKEKERLVALYEDILAEH